MPSEITMPQQSDTMTEGTVVKWLKKEGDKVKQGEIIAEIETDKATMEMEAFESGTIASILVPEGGKVPVGAAIAVLATGKENPADVKKQFAGKPQAAAPAAGPTLAESVSQTPRKQAASAGSERVPAAASHGGTVATLEGASVGEMHERDEIGHGATQGHHGASAQAGDGNGHGNRVFASPLARRIAADKGIDLSQVRGTGPGGRIVQKDVLDFSGPTAAATAMQAAVVSVPTPQRGTEVIPLTKMRSAIAAALQRSKQQIPHFYETIDVDVEDLSSLRVRLNDQLKSQNVKLSLADLLSKAVTAALLRHPALNATFDGTNITRHGDVHLGVAVAVPDGLIVPVLRNADRMGLREIREKSGSLIERARSQRLKQDEMSGGTFTISSLGTFGIREFSAIINPPQVAILAVGAAEKRPVVRDNQIVPRTVMTLTLSADHRVVDGATAAEFLRTLRTMLEEPGMMLV